MRSQSTGRLKIEKCPGNKVYFNDVNYSKIVFTLQKARNSEGYNSDDMSRGIGCTPQFTEKTNIHAEMTLNQLMRFSWSAIPHCSKWSDNNRKVAKTDRHSMVPMEETAYKVLLLKFTSSFVRLSEARRRTIPMMMAE